MLAALSRQTLDRESWELVVIDNASDPSLDGSVDLSWHPQGRMVREDELGLTAARLRARRETRAAVVVFVDDDNVLDDDYLAVVAALAATLPGLGAWGGQLRPEFETEPRRALRPYLTAIGIREFVGDHRSSRLRNWDAAPYGAGLCVRREVLDEYAELVRADPLRAALGVRGTGLLRCEDIDLAFTAADLGYETGIFADLRLTHLLPPVRTTEPYLLRLHEGNAYSGTIVEYVHGGTLDRGRPPGRLRRAARRIRRGRVATRVRAAEERGRRAAREQIAAQARDQGRVP